MYAGDASMSSTFSKSSINDAWLKLATALSTMLSRCNHCVGISSYLQAMILRRLSEIVG